MLLLQMQDKESTTSTIKEISMVLVTPVQEKKTIKRLQLANFVAMEITGGIVGWLR
jgi:hypothetical protein